MKEIVIQIFADNYSKEPGQINTETRIAEDLQAKSLDMFALLAMLEGALGSAPDLNTAMKMKTVQEFVDFYN